MFMNFLDSLWDVVIILAVLVSTPILLGAAGHWLYKKVRGDA